MTDQNTPDIAAAKADFIRFQAKMEEVEKVESRLENRIKEVKEDLKGDIRGVKEDLHNRITRLETRLHRFLSITTFWAGLRGICLVYLHNFDI